MSDRYRFDEERTQFDEVRLLRDIERMFEGKIPRELDERVSCHEDTPLSLSVRQRQRLWIILRDEIGPAAAIRALRRIEDEA